MFENESITKNYFGRRSTPTNADKSPRSALTKPTTDSSCDNVQRCQNLPRRYAHETSSLYRNGVHGMDGVGTACAGASFRRRGIRLPQEDRLERGGDKSGVDQSARPLLYGRERFQRQRDQLESGTRQPERADSEWLASQLHQGRRHGERHRDSSQG